eukprot:3545596-Rhodomonas_salina.1
MSFGVAWGSSSAPNMMGSSAESTPPCCSTTCSRRAPSSAPDMAERQSGTRGGKYAEGPLEEKVVTPALRLAAAHTCASARPHAFQ